MPTDPPQGSPPFQLPPTITADYQRDWPRYFDAVAAKGPRDTLVRAADLFGPVYAADPPLAVDIACGEGRDTRELLARGWRVCAFDATPLGIERLRAGVPADQASRLSTHVLRMEEAAGDAELPARADLVNASFALPFCEPGAFPALWAWMQRVVRPGGLFAGQLFGDRDEWAPIRPGSHHTRGAVERLLAGFALEHFEEVEKEGEDALGITKRHHLYHIVARKR